MAFSLLDLLFPSNKDLTVDVSRLRSHPFTEDTKRLRERELSCIDAIHAACPYTSPVLKNAMHLFKYRRIPSLCDALSRLMVDASFPQVEGAVLCPVPLYWTRQFWRGFNQAALLAQAMSTGYHLPMHALLTRTRPTGHQMRRTREERLVAVKNAFSCSQKVDVSTVILIDDIATTGATLDACADALKQCGVARVEAWVIAHG